MIKKLIAILVELDEFVNHIRTFWNKSSIEKNVNDFLKEVNDTVKSKTSKHKPQEPIIQQPIVNPLTTPEDLMKWDKATIEEKKKHKRESAHKDDLVEKPELKTKKKYPPKEMSPEAKAKYNAYQKEYYHNVRKKKLEEQSKARKEAWLTKRQLNAIKKKAEKLDKMKSKFWDKLDWTSNEEITGVITFVKPKQ